MEVVESRCLANPNPKTDALGIEKVGRPGIESVGALDLYIFTGVGRRRRSSTRGSRSMMAHSHDRVSVIIVIARYNGFHVVMPEVYGNLRNDDPAVVTHRSHRNQS